MNTIQCIEALELLRTIPDQSVDMILTDPKYETTQLKFDQIPLDWPALWKEFHRIAKERAALVMTAAQPFTTDLINSNRKNFRYAGVWVKTTATGFLDANRRFMPAHEDICVFGKKRPLYYPKNAMRKGEAYKTKKGSVSEHYGAQKAGVISNSDGDRYPTSVFYYALDSDKLHPTQKPLGLFRELIALYTMPDQIVVDPFVGSGTTAVAAHLLGRKFICGDNDPEYVSKANKRLAECDPLIDLPTQSGMLQLSMFSNEEHP